MTFSDGLAKMRSVLRTSRSGIPGRVVRRAGAVATLLGAEGRSAVVHVSPAQDARPMDFVLYVLFAANSDDTEFHTAISYDRNDDNDVIVDRIHRWLDVGAAD